MTTSSLNLVRVGLAFCGLLLAAALGWWTLHAADLALVLTSWSIPAVAAVHLVEQAGCGCAWHTLVAPPSPSRWSFCVMRWIRASVAALVPVSGVGAALVAVRLSIRAGLTVEMASASLILDATMEMITQLIFVALGFGLLLVSIPDERIVEWAATTLTLALMLTAAFVIAQRRGGLKLIEMSFARLAARWPRLLPLAEARLHDRLMALHQRRRSALVAGTLHLVSWLLGAGEIWLVLLALEQPTSAAKCLIIESLSMAARSAGFFVPGALGIQEIALVTVCGLVGMPSQIAMQIAIVKRLRDVIVGVPGLIAWQWIETRGIRLVWARQRS
jgi:putative membrane protein